MYLYLGAICIVGWLAAPQKGLLRLNSRRAFETNSRARSMRPCSGIRSNTRARMRIYGYLQPSLRCQRPLSATRAVERSTRDGQLGERTLQILCEARAGTEATFG